MASLRVLLLVAFLILACVLLAALALGMNQITPALVGLDGTRAQAILQAYRHQWLWLTGALVVLWLVSALAVQRLVWRTLRRGAHEAMPEIHVKATGPDDAELLDEVRARVAPSVHEQRAPIEMLEQALNRDPDTGLANRAYFINALKRRLRDDVRQGAVSGYVLLVRARDLARLQGQSTRAEMADWLRLVGRRMRETLDEFPQVPTLAARLNAADFAVLLALDGGPQVMQPIQRLRAVFDGLRLPLDANHRLRWAFVLTDYTAQCEVRDVLMRLDQCLMWAESAEHDDVEYLSHADRDDAIPRMGESSWEALITSALDQDGLRLRVRTVDYRGANEVYTLNEAGLELKDADADHTVDGADFMPAATRLGLSAPCDLRALSLALNWLGARPTQALVVRISLASLLDAHFAERLRALCELAEPALLTRLVVEIDAFSLSRHHHAVRELAEVVQPLGVHLGLRGVTRALEAVCHLHELQLHHVKLGGAFMRTLRSSPGAMQLAGAILATAVGQGARVCVDDVDDESSAQWLQQRGACLRAASAPAA